jgi:hypothetical protein
MTTNEWEVLFAGLTAAFTGAIAVTGIWALVYAKRQLREDRESQKVHHLTRFVEQFENEPMVQYRTATAQKRLAGEPYPAEAQRILGFFETIALLVDRGFLDEYDVWSSFSYWMFNVYADFRSDIEQEQKEDPAYYRNFCDLIERLREIEAEPPATNSDRPSREQVREFWQDELETVPGAPVRKRQARGRKSNARNAKAKKDLSSGPGPIGK